MKNIYLFALLCLCFSCKSQEIVLLEANLESDEEPRRCYYSYINDGDDKENEDSFVLEIIPPKFREVKKHVSPDELEQYKTDSDYYKFETLKVYVKYVFKDADLAYFTKSENPIGYTLCLSVQSSGHTFLKKSDLASVDYIVVYSEMIEPSKIIKYSVKIRPKKLKENQRYFPAGKWSELKPAIYGSH